jgi:hypothetical protein
MPNKTITEELRVKIDFEVLNVPSLAQEHITIDDVALLHRCDEQSIFAFMNHHIETGMLVDSYDGGFWIKFANGDADDEYTMDSIKAWFSPAFVSVIEKLREMGHNRVRFDQDTPTCKFLPVLKEWSEMS